MIRVQNVQPPADGCGICRRSAASRAGGGARAEEVDTAAGRGPGERAGKQPLVARFGGIPLTRNKDAKLNDRVPAPIRHPRKELVARLLKRRCELCGDAAKVMVHQVRKLARLPGPGQDQPAWAALMIKKRRKTLVVSGPHKPKTHIESILNGVSAGGCVAVNEYGCGEPGPR
ncbi:HNH endonuclease [Nonomuraea sp. H19]|uniref:HNH endonuclease n=1 Tax=Nonomuraea sp. H19 TaxID=3452206 RepID=UPI003F8AEDCA